MSIGTLRFGSSLFSSLYPQVPALEGRPFRVLDLGGGNRPIFDDVSVGEHRVSADIEPAKLSVPSVACRGEMLPFRDGSFDLVVSRVALLYMNIARALAEVRRVLVPGGVLWATLHLPRMAVRRIRTSARKLDLVDVAYQSYVLPNCGVECISSYQIPWKGGRIESVQTQRLFERALRRANLVDIRTELKTDERELIHFGATARKRIE